MTGRILFLVAFACVAFYQVAEARELCYGARKVPFDESACNKLPDSYRSSHYAHQESPDAPENGAPVDEYYVGHMRFFPDLDQVIGTGLIYDESGYIIQKLTGERRYRITF